MLLLLTGLVFLFFDSRRAACAFCNPADHKNPFSPSLAINTLEFPEENALPVGYNITIVCTSNASSKNFGTVYLGHPYWITFYFNDALRYIKECGGRDGNVDSEDSKVCEYSIQNATKNDSGNYTCWAYNQITCTEATLSLDFRAPSPPSFMVYPPKEMNISAGSKVTMSCEASGIPRPVVQWYKDGFPVPRKNTAGILGISTVTIGSFTTADQGKYWCEARSTEGWNRSSSTRLSLKSDMTTDRLTDEMSFYRHPESVTAFSGDQVVFMCAVKCSSVINITWLKDGMINDDGKVESFLGKENVSSVLTINSVKDENHGNYSCLAANAIGRTTSQVAVLFITGDTSKSAGVSKIIWIVPVVTAAVVTVLVILIFAIHKKFRGADLEHNQEVKELQRFPHLYVRENNVSQQISNTYVVPPNFQAASMTMESRE